MDPGRRGHSRGALFFRCGSLGRVGPHLVSSPKTGRRVMIHPQAQRGPASADNAELQRRELELRRRREQFLLVARLAQSGGEGIEAPPVTYQKRSRVQTTRRQIDV